MYTRDHESLATRYTESNPVSGLVITMSDRAHAGEYEDKGGAMAALRLRAHFAAAGIAFNCDSIILPDDPDRLRECLISSRDSGVDIVVTTGGTGIGPRDITPDVVLELADKVIPGIMEVVRVRQGLERPLTALSRTVAATVGTMLVYAVPGNPNGVADYMDEILKSVDHLLCVLHGIEAH